MTSLSGLFASLRSYLERKRRERAGRIAEAEEQRRKREAEQAELKRQRDFLYKLGNDFEDTVASMFDPSAFRIIHRTPRDDECGGRYVRGMSYPDLRLVEIPTGRSFWVECKYRAHVGPKWEIEWCSEEQLTRYKRTMYHFDEKVFIMIGLGGTTENPERVYCLDLDRINFTTLFYGTYKYNRVRGTVSSLDELTELSNRTGGRAASSQ